MTHRVFIAAYIMASGRNGTIYSGSTVDLIKRVWEHKSGRFEGFTKENALTRLVWFEQHALIADAIRRERRLKKWNRDWKLKLIEETNPDWTDLAADWWPETELLK